MLKLFIADQQKKKSKTNNKFSCKSEAGFDIPDPIGSLFSAISAQAIAEANNKHRRQLKTWLEVAKHGPHKYSPNLQSEIASHGVAAAARHIQEVEETR